MTTTTQSRLLSADAIRTGMLGLRNRKGRTLLTAIGIAIGIGIGIASMVAMLSISASSEADLIAEIDELGTNLLKVRAGSDISGQPATLAAEAAAMVRRTASVEQASSVSRLDTDVQRNRFVDEPNGLKVFAAESQLLDTLEGTIARGRFLDPETARLPTVVLSSVAAQRLGIDTVTAGPTVQIAGTTFAVIGILDQLALHPDIDRAVLIGNEAAQDFLGADGIPTAIYLRAEPDLVEQVGSVLPRTTNPADPNEVAVSRPSDGLQARADVDKNLQNLLLGLGGVGIANVMIISVLERRAEIGLRRALGATRRHIATQFVLESAALAALYPATRAARLDPADAVRPS